MAAWIAGTSAANTAVATPTSTARPAFSADRRAGFTSGFRNIDSSSARNWLNVSSAKRTPSGTPRTAPIRPRNAAATANRTMIWSRVAPIARSTPMSARRSATVTAIALYTRNRPTIIAPAEHISTPIWRPETTSCVLRRCASGARTSARRAMTFAAAAATASRSAPGSRNRSIRFTFCGKKASAATSPSPPPTATIGGTGRTTCSACPTLMPMKFFPSGATGESLSNSTTPIGRHSTFRDAYRTTNGFSPPVRRIHSS
ncbi:hypothetical protein FTUN_4670 [Frigoriglobus tundricola]|uniref:Uncharacterized protein n=1 Tax=Frigoriglobus tundricola TaxID=2774151 RepID=A0A6M5YSS4_9BACT|nr:hypothetical protein [Frigoriglobus tundricola]QJW97105.1 hypothetical protein FTUN_4670 [Frigoriglobus tundricola]